MTSTPRRAPKVAVVLCGSGRADGSEIHESVSCLIHLARLGASYSCFAPDAPQREVVDHLTGQPAAETRNQLVEAARIARGDIKPLASLDPAAFDAVVFPGGFGAAKNLCTFAADGANCSVIPDVERIVRAFHESKKPIAMCCIAPVIGAKVLGTKAKGPGVRVTVGDDAGVGAAIASWGSTSITTPVDRACTDDANRIASAPAYMYAKANPHEVYEGIGRMIESALGMINPDRAIGTL